MEYKFKTRIDYKPILEACKQGKFHEDLKLLYQMPYREEIPWIDFPDWARVDTVFEGCHEG